jgi:hypothetical protein
MVDESPRSESTRPAARRWLLRELLRLGMIAIVAFVVLVLLAAGIGWWMFVRMPGSSFRGPLPPLTAHESGISADLRRHVHKLAGEIGERNMWRPKALAAAAEYVEDEFRRAGHSVIRDPYSLRGRECFNLAIELSGKQRSQEIVLVGAHYDSVDCPGANDNGSGVAALLALARELAGREYPRTLRLVAFVNEEPPYFQTADMGSRVYARQCRERGENIVAMIALETIGYYSERPGSQQYPPLFEWFYPSRGDFIAFAGNPASARLLREAIASFRRHARFPSEGAVVPGAIAEAGWSDHWSFWHEGYAAIMVTDTAPFRYPYYHRPEDTPDKLDYDRMARVVAGLAGVVADLAE